MSGTDPAAEWFKWWNSRLDKTEDARFRYTWERAIQVGQRVAIERTASWAGLVPLLQDVLDYLIETAIERSADMGVGGLTGVDGNGHGGADTTNAAPDLTVDTGAQRHLEDDELFASVSNLGLSFGWGPQR